MTTVFVHGYNYKEGESPEAQYRYWRRFTEGKVAPFYWVSHPRRLTRAWGEGSWNTYHWAWRRAIDTAAPDLAALAEALGPVDVVCHSLGSRVVYEAMAISPQSFNRILTLNGADSEVHARFCIEHSSGVRVLCVKTRSDNVLRWLGQVFTPVWGAEHVIGFHGMAKPWPEGWSELDLGKAGDDPGWKDHDYSFKNPRFYPAYLRFLSGVA